jgi:hypothetical protein
LAASQKKPAVEKSPCLCAFWLERFLPAAVRGPVDFFLVMGDF